MFFDELDKFGDNVALISKKFSTTYCQLQCYIDKIKNCLTARSLVICVCRNSFESIVGYLAILQNRSVPLMINSTIDRALFQRLLETYNPNFIWAPVGFFKGTVLFSIGEYELIQINNGLLELYPELALLLTTSGSTGSPKLARQSYKNIESNANAIVDYLNISERDRPITTLPMSYTYGLSIINSHILKGAAIILTEASLVDAEFWTMLKNNEATTFGGVPYSYEILKKLRFLRMEIPSLRYLTQAGGRLGIETHLEFASELARKGLEFIVMYGQTEATARMSYVPQEFAVSKAGSIGIAIPGGDLWLEDANGNRIETSDTVGELVYQGPNVTLGYAVCIEDLNKGDKRNGILYTGDMAKYDEDGFFYIVGRKKRFLKIYGNRVNLDEVESLLKSKGYDVACIGDDDRMKIYVQDKDAGETVSLLSKKLGIHSSAFTAISIEKIPRNESGKVLYSELG